VRYPWLGKDSDEQHDTAREFHVDSHSLHYTGEKPGIGSWKDEENRAVNRSDLSEERKAGKE
jgi:hypothetical protein